MATRDRARTLWGRITSSDLGLSLIAVVAGLAAGAIILAVTSDQPLLAYGAFWQGALGSRRGIGETLYYGTQLILTGLAVAISFRCGLFNLGAQGQILLGAMGAAWAGYWIQGLPPIIHLPLALLVGAALGTAWSAIAGYLKARLNMHEVITTLMMNYLVVNLKLWVVGIEGPMKQEGMIPASPPVLESARLPRIWGDARLHIGVVIALVCVVAAWYLLFRTRLGYKIRAVGLSASAAEYGGIQVARNIVVTMAISGFLAGLAGAIEVLAINYRFSQDLTASYAWDAIAVALLGALHPVGTFLAALLFGALSSGFTATQGAADVSRDTVLIITALIIFLMVLVRSRKTAAVATIGGTSSAGLEQRS
jgi:ABC-type uncharacterized transport system permease subunit